MVLNLKAIGFDVNKSGGGLLIRLGRLTVSILMVLSATFVFHTTALAASSFNIMDAHERGVSKSGEAKGTVIPTYDEASRKDVLEFDYSLPKGAVVECWIKNFPPEMGPDVVNTANRICDQASEDEILISEDLYQSLHPGISTQHPRQISAKGKTKPITVYPLTSANTAFAAQKTA